MRVVGNIFKLIGCLILFLPLAAFIGAFGYVYLNNPSDQAGWGALVGGLMILNFGSVPLGLLLLLLGLAFGAASPRQGEASRPPSSPS